MDILEMCEDKLHFANNAYQVKPMSASFSNQQLDNHVRKIILIYMYTYICILQCKLNLKTKTVFSYFGAHWNLGMEYSESTLSDAAWNR